MADSAADAKSEAQKRRSTRISQAVPITVIGVDALGRPFQERTSTVVVNCHGFRYQSKHYVLKNTWVTIEVPSAEAQQPPHSVRARVTWIQRPRTVRELFQIAAELEIAGNLWGIAFPQHDWFAFPEHAGLDPASSQMDPAEAGWRPELASLDNVRILPVGSAIESSSALAEQISLLLADARRELQSAVRETVAQAAAAETAHLIPALQKQVEQAAELSAQNIAEASAKRALQESLGRTALKTQEHLKALQHRWSEEMEAGSQQARGDFLTRLAESAQAQTAVVRRELAGFIEQAREQIERAFLDGESAAAASRESLSALCQQAAAAAGTAAEEMHRLFRGRTEEIQTDWHSRLHADLAAATELWNQRIESSLESAAQRSAERLARNSQAAAERLESELGSRISSLGKVFAEATGEAEAKLNALRGLVQAETARAQGALVQAQSAAVGIEEHAGKFEQIARNAQQELQRRAATVLEAQSRELARRSEGVLAASVLKLQPALEGIAQQSLARLAPRIDGELEARLQPAAQAYARLERGVAAVDEALRRQQETITCVSDQSVETTRGRLQETINRMTHHFEEAGSAASARWIAEIDAKATETTHAAFESLFKTAEWYEKKAQVQMQSALEKGLQQAGEGLRDKAGEISSLFASELDHYNRSYVEHAHTQIEEAVREVFDRARRQSADLVAESVASLAQQAERRAQAVLDSIQTQAGAALSQVSADAAAQLVRVRSDIAEEGARLAEEFRQILASDSHEALATAHQDLTLLASSAVTELRSEGRAQQAQLSQALAASSEQAIGEYRKRLEAASNSWLLTTVTRLDQQSQQLIQSIAQTAQEQLREACVQMFAEIGENLRQRNIAPCGPPNAKGAAASSI